MRISELTQIIESVISQEVRKTIIRESLGDKKEVYHVTCEGEPIDSFDTQEEANRAVTQAIGGSNLNLNSGYGASLLGKVNSYAGDISLASSTGTSSPNQSAATLVPNAPSSATTLAAATTAVSQEKMTLASAAPVVNNVTNNNVNNSTSGGGSSTSTASVYDDLFAKLVGRALA